MNAFKVLALAAIAIVPLIAFLGKAARLEENIVAFVVAITLYHGPSVIRKQ